MWEVIINWKLQASGKDHSPATPDFSPQGLCWDSDLQKCKVMSYIALGY